MNIIKTDVFQKWIHSLKDQRAVERITMRLARFQYGLFGDVKPIGDGVSEIRIDYGGGYRIYYTKRGNEIIILLCGGDKSSQQRDITKAKLLLNELEVKNG